MRLVHIYDRMTEEFVHRKCAHADIYPAHYACSLGGHIFNLVNQKTEVLMANAIPVDTRLHTMFVAPPGCCLDQWSIVTMADQSKTFLRDVVIGDKLASQNGQENIVTNVMKSLKINMLRIQPHNMCVSAEHEIKTKDDWAFAGDLQEGDLIETRYSKEGLQFLGWWIAEGRFEGKWWTPVIANKDESVIEELETVANKYGCSWNDAGPMEYRFTHGKNSSERNKLAEWLRYFGYEKGRDTNSGNKHVPEELMKYLELDGLVWILSQMWRGDGTDRTQMRYASKSRMLLEQVCDILDLVHVEYSVYDYGKDTAEVYVHEEFRERLYDAFERASHFTQFKGLMKIDTVREVLYRRYAIDLETTQSHFVANDVVVHNSKTFWQEQFLRGKWCILEGTMTQHGFEGSTTEAGFVGSATMSENGDPVVTPGLAKVYEEGIVGFEEFSALTAMMKSSHSQQLDAALLLALDRGYVVKRLRAGKIGYKTNVTVWAGTQPSRFDLTSGLGRRFYYLLLIPTEEDRRVLREKIRAGWGVRMDVERTNKIRASIDELKDRLFKVKTVKKDPSVNLLLDELNMPPYEEQLYVRLILGYKVITEDFGETLTLDIDPTVEMLCRQESIWRKAIRRGPEIAEVVSLLRANGNSMSMIELRDAMMEFGMDWKRSSELITELSKMKILAMGETNVSLRGKWDG